MSWLKTRKRKKEEETYRFRGETTSALTAKREALEKEKERLKIKSDIIKTKKELRKLSHPHQEAVRKTTLKAGSRIGGFGGGLVKEGVRSHRTLNRNLRRRRRTISNIRLRDSKTFRAPDGEDISLSGSIMGANWSGPRNVMNTQFFSSPDNRDLLGTKAPIDITTGNKKKEQKFF